MSFAITPGGRHVGQVRPSYSEAVEKVVNAAFSQNVTITKTVIKEKLTNESPSEVQAGVEEITKFGKEVSREGVGSFVGSAVAEGMKQSQRRLRWKRTEKLPPSQDTRYGEISELFNKVR